MSAPCGGILPHNGGSYRASSKLRDLAGTHLQNSRSDSSQTSPSGRVMTRKRLMYAQIGEEEQVISPPYTRTPLDESMRGRKKRKQGEDNALAG